jgi:hypothetical protein
MSFQRAKWAVISCAFLLSILFSSQAVIAAHPSAEVPEPTLQAGDLVLGPDTLVPGLEVQSSTGNEVFFVRERDPLSAYGANYQGGMNIANGCMEGGWGFTDFGDKSYSSVSRKHEYDFTFTPGRTVSEFTISVADWGDFFPFGTSLNMSHEARLTAYDVGGNIVSEDAISFTSTGWGSNARETEKFGNLAISGDACTATHTQPGNYTFSVTGTGITRVTLRFIGQQSIDPNMALHRPFSITFEPLNSPPDATDDSGSSKLNTLVGISVLSNDTDPDGDPLNIISSDTTTSKGGAIVCAGGDCSYKPAFGFTGTDTFNYTACDDENECDVATVTVEITNPQEVAGCTYTQGYWKTHSDTASSKYDATWDLLPNGRDTVFFLSGQTYFQVTDSAVKTNPYYSLGQQYIAAELNMRSGASIPDAELAAFQQATALFQQVTPNQVKSDKALQAQFKALNTILDAYNNGLAGPGHCG